MTHDLKKTDDHFVAKEAQCVIDEVGSQIEFLLTHMRDFAINLVSNGDIEALSHAGLREFLDRVARGEITIGKATTS